MFIIRETLRLQIEVTEHCIRPVIDPNDRNALYAGQKPALLVALEQVVGKHAGMELLVTYGPQILIAYQGSNWLGELPPHIMSWEATFHQQTSQPISFELTLTPTHLTKDTLVKKWGEA